MVLLVYYQGEKGQDSAVLWYRISRGLREAAFDHTHPVAYIRERPGESLCERRHRLVQTMQSLYRFLLALQ